MLMLDHARRRTFQPIAASSDLVPRHVFAGRLWGQELAVWRADDRHVNVWENRCLHRGVRLTIGINLGTELMCQYHGWRYANRTAGCTYIPAHPADAPARTICNRSYPAVERAGLVWAALDAAADPATLPDLPENGLVLRPLPLDVPPEEVEAALAQAFPAAGVRFLVQPVDAGRSIVRGQLEPAPAEPLATLRHWNTALCRLRARLEAVPRPPIAPIPQEHRPVAAELAGLPPPAERQGRLRVRVAARTALTPDITAFRLVPLTGNLPAHQPGAHIDVHLPNGLVRQYSITNGPDETTAYVIGVKREAAGGGGSACLHDAVREGDVLAISPPLNNFPLRRDALHTVFIAGGIGLTPLLAMARTLELDGRPFTFHVFARAAEALPFRDQLDAMGDKVVRHLALDPDATGEALRQILEQPRDKRQLYSCGPPAMLDLTRRLAAETGWPEAAVHFEYFKNETPLDQSSSFEVALARSAVTLQVPAGRSIVQVLREHGIAIATSCEQGACGTCRVAVIEGEPDHQDVHLTATEKARGDCLMTCVSRSKSPRLVLDL
jgi:ferredoxin-NADP reductase/nitrite reductase/ring-hydroxylating ferredoxin subunit